MSLNFKRTNGVPAETLSLAEPCLDTQDITLYIGSGSQNIPYIFASKQYVAFLTQSGSNAPSASILINSIGDIDWQYSSAGVYTGTLVLAFTNGKTIPMVSNNTNANSGNSIHIKRFDNNTVYITTANSGSGLSDDILSETPVDIKVYY